jgi:hypothetical protein
MKATLAGAGDDRMIPSKTAPRLVARMKWATIQIFSEKPFYCQTKIWEAEIYLTSDFPPRNVCALYGTIERF